MLIYQTNDYKEKNLLMNLNQSWIKHESYTHTQIETNVYIFINIYIQKISRHTFTHTDRKYNYKWNFKTTPTPHTHHIKYRK